MVTNVNPVVTSPCPENEVLELAEVKWREKRRQGREPLPSDCPSSLACRMLLLLGPTVWARIRNDVDVAGASFTLCCVWVSVRARVLQFTLLHLWKKTQLKFRALCLKTSVTSLLRFRDFIFSSLVSQTDAVVGHMFLFRLFPKKCKEK